jgi:hypothetical protein
MKSKRSVDVPAGRGLPDVLTKEVRIRRYGMGNATSTTSAARVSSPGRGGRGVWGGAGESRPHELAAMLGPAMLIERRRDAVHLRKGKD